MALRTIVLVHVVLLIFSRHVLSNQVVETLPGYPGKLPFKLETGYVGVGDEDQIQLFYYFTESERNPVSDPLIVWNNGGPGCSGLSGLVYQIGPLYFDYNAFNGSLPSLIINQFSWTKFASVIFLDSPVGTGFSYSKTQEGYYTSDTQQADAMDLFLRKWMVEHPDFANNPIYIAGDSYAGKMIPIAMLAIAAGNEAMHNPFLNLKGYMIGNPTTEMLIDVHSRAEHMYLEGLISTELYEDARKHCASLYTSTNESNAECMKVYEHIGKCLAMVCDSQVPDRHCSYDTPIISKRLNGVNEDFQYKSIDICSGKESPDIYFWCKSEEYLQSYIWANNVEVQKALSIGNNTISLWRRCNDSLVYEKNMPNPILFYHKAIIGSGYRALVYSGEDDVIIPYTGTLTWIQSLNFTIVEEWRPWFVEGQIAGFTMKFANLSIPGNGLVFTTVKGAKHTGAEFRPKECFAMVDRWLSYHLI